MEKWVYAVYTVCADHSKKGEFHSWYDNIHVPDILKCPGFVRAERYELREPNDADGEYLALYHIETDDIDRTMDEMRKMVAGYADQGRMSDLVIAVGGGLFRQITPVMERKK